MNVLLLVLAAVVLVVGATEDSIAVESDVSLRKLRRFRPQEESVGNENGDAFRSLKKARHWDHAYRKREARREEAEWTPASENEGVYETDGRSHPGHGASNAYQQRTQGERYRYRSRQQRGSDHSGSYRAPSADEDTGSKQKYIIYETHQPAHDNSQGEEQSSAYSDGSFLSHIKENMQDGRLIGYSSFIEHFSENDDAEELKAAMREGSMDDIKRLVPKSEMSFQMFHGPEEERKIRVEPSSKPKQADFTWNEVNQWHHLNQAVAQEAPTYHVRPAIHVSPAPEKKKKIKKPHHMHRPKIQEEPRKPAESLGIDSGHKLVGNEVYGNQDPQIIPSISYQLPSETYTAASQYDVSENPEQAKYLYHTYSYDSDQGAWSPIEFKPYVDVKESEVASSNHRKQINTPKPPESSKLYYEYTKSPEKSGRETHPHSYQAPAYGYSLEEHTRAPEHKEYTRTSEHKERTRATEHKQYTRTPEHKEHTRASEHKEYTRAPEHKGHTRSSEQKERPRGSEQRQKTKIGRIVVDQKHTSKYYKKYGDSPTNTPEYHTVRKPVRSQSHQYASNHQATHNRPTITSEEAVALLYPSATPTAPTRYTTTAPKKHRAASQNWSKPDPILDNYQKYVKSSTNGRSEKRLQAPVGKLEKILNQQVTETSYAPDRERPSKDSGNIYITTQYQNEPTRFYDFAQNYGWLPNYKEDNHARGSHPAVVQTSPPAGKPTAAVISIEASSTEHQNRSRDTHEVSTEKGPIVLSPENQNGQREFSVTASYKIDKNRSDDVHLLANNR